MNQFLLIRGGSRRSRRAGGRHFEREGGAPILALADRGKSPAMRHNNPPRNRESEAQSLQAFPALASSLLERLENFHQHVRFNSASSIGDADTEIPGIIVRADRNRAAGGSEFDRVLNQI